MGNKPGKNQEIEQGYSGEDDKKQPENPKPDSEDNSKGETPPESSPPPPPTTPVMTYPPGRNGNADDNFGGDRKVSDLQLNA